MAPSSSAVPQPPLTPTPTLTPTPLPRAAVCAILLIILGTAINLNVLFPFVAWMVADFLPDRDFTTSDGEFDKVAKQAAVAAKSGWLAAQFMLGQFLSAYVWAWLADKYGRRPVLLVSTAAVAVVSLMFGFSVNYPMAIASRLLTGLLNGNMGVSKTYMAEICDASNQAKGFSLLGITWALGAIVGPLLGGFMSRRGIIPGFAYAPPLICNTLICCVALVVGALYLPESRPKSSSAGELEKSKKEAEYADGDEALLIIGGSGDNEAETALDSRKTNAGSRRHNQDFNLEEDDEMIRFGESDSAPLLPTTLASAAAEEPEPSSKGCCGWYHESKLKRILHTRNIVLSVALYGAIGFVWIIYDETFPIWSRLPDSEGGLNFEPNDVGIAIAISGVIMMVVQIILYTPLERRFGALFTFRLGAVLGVVLFLTLPLLNTVAPMRASSQFADDLEGLVESGGMSFAFNGSVYQAAMDSYVEENACQAEQFCPSSSSGAGEITHCIAAPAAATDTLRCRQMTFTLHRMPPLTQDALADFLDTLTASLHCPLDRFVGISLNTNRTVSLAITDSTQSKADKGRFWLLVSVFVGLRSTSNLLQLTSTFLIISNVAGPSLMAAVNGLGQSVNSLLRFCGPAVAGNALGWSLHNHTYPFDYHFVYVIAAIGQVIALVISMQMNRSVNKRVQDAVRVVQRSSSPSTPTPHPAPAFAEC